MVTDYKFKLVYEWQVVEPFQNSLDWKSCGCMDNSLHWDCVIMSHVFPKLQGQEWFTPCRQEFEYVWEHSLYLTVKLLASLIS